MPARELTAEHLRSVLGYDPATGAFWWLVAPCIRMKAGAQAGSTKLSGYREIKVAGRRYLAHRLAWLHVHGTWPKDQIDHIDENKANNAIANLREATNAQNNCNRKAYRTNVSGLKGVSWDKNASKWRAQIAVNKKVIHLGLFNDAGDASRAYAEASKRLHGDFANTGSNHAQTC